MHILVGGVVGLVIGVGLAYVTALALKKPLTREALIGAAVGGLVTGAVSAATLGVGGAASAGLTKTVVSSTTAGAAGRGARRIVDNVQHQRPIQEGLLEDTAIGAAGGAVTAGAGAALEPFGRRAGTALGNSVRRAHFGPRLQRGLDTAGNLARTSAKGSATGAAGAATRQSLGNSFRGERWDKDLGKATREGAAAGFRTSLAGHAKGPVKENVEHGLKTSPSRGLIDALGSAY